MGVPDDSRLMHTLTCAEVGTARQAVTWLGRAIHVGVARCIVRELIARGWVTRGLRYGSAYSGIDTFAAAVEEETAGRFTYVFACEWGERERLALRRTWEERGLSEGRIWEDAEEAGRGETEAVDLWVASPDCGKHSKRNHEREGEEQAASLEGIEASLGYLYRCRPKVVVVENVAEASIVGPLGAMLRRLPGYEWEDGVMDAERDARAPVMSRARHIWMGRRAE